MTTAKNLQPVVVSPARPVRVNAKEAHRKIRELTEAVARGHRVRQTERGSAELEREAFGRSGKGGDGGSSNREPR